MSIAMSFLSSCVFSMCIFSRTASKSRIICPFAQSPLYLHLSISLSSSPNKYSFHLPCSELLILENCFKWLGIISFYLIRLLPGQVLHGYLNFSGESVFGCSSQFRIVMPGNVKNAPSVIKSIAANKLTYSFISHLKDSSYV